MSNYVSSIRRAPRTLTDDEQKKLLRVSGLKRDDLRDHMLFSFALGTALRESELVALNVGDVWDHRKATKGKRRGGSKTKIVLREYKRSKEGTSVRQIVFVPDGVREKLPRYIAWKKANGEPVAVGAPLFFTRTGGGRARKQRGRIADRTFRHIFAKWQERAGFDQRYSCHDLRHTSITNLYRATGDVRKAQLHARHASLNSTMIYTHVSDEELLRSVRGMRS